MTRYGRDPEQINRDIVIALAHSDFRDRPFIEAYRDVRRRRGEWV